MARQHERRDRDRDREERDSEFVDKLVHINRVAKVVKGGKRFGFAALVVVGDQKGRVGFGHGKAREVPEAIRKATEAAKRALVRVPLREGRTLHHDVQRPLGRRQGRAARGACRHRHHRRRPDARRVRDARHPRRGGQVARHVQPLQHGARHVRRAEARRRARARSPPAAARRSARSWRAGATRGAKRVAEASERRRGTEASANMADKIGKTVTVEQIGSPIRRPDGSARRR